MMPSIAVTLSKEEINVRTSSCISGKHRDYQFSYPKLFHKHRDNIDIDQDN